MFAKLVIVIFGLSAFTGMANASAQYMQNSSSAPPSPAVLAECRELGISPETCTEMEILKRQKVCIGCDLVKYEYEPPTLYPIIVGLGVAVLAFGVITIKKSH
jgi:hypothetical protein